MAKENETIAEIIAAMRGDGHTGPADALEWVRIKLEHYADRLEAALKRELGDAAKLREALEMVCDAHYTKEVGGELYEGFEVEVDDGTGRPLICVVKNALSAPPRNCDVGTADEQAKRLHRFCMSQDCETCPCNLGKADGRCEFAWMQMPYEEGGGEMSGKIRNPARRCKICGGKCKKQFRYCKLCTKERRRLVKEKEANE